MTKFEAIENTCNTLKVNIKNEKLDNEMKKVLYFEGAGMDYELNNYSDVCNYRIRTSFFNNEGIQYYIELGRSWRPTNKKKINFEWALRIDHLFLVEDRDSDNYEISTDWKKIRELDYTTKDITKWINENLNCSFETIQVLNNFYGYRVHGDHGVYVPMEEIELNHERAIARKEAYNKIDMEYRSLLNEKYSIIGMNGMDSESISIRCHASSKALEIAGLEQRIVRIPIEY